jgi:hypothetical protein
LSSFRPTLTPPPPQCTAAAGIFAYLCNRNSGAPIYAIKQIDPACTPSVATLTTITGFGSGATINTSSLEIASPGNAYRSAPPFIPILMFLFSFSFPRSCFSHFLSSSHPPFLFFTLFLLLIPPFYSHSHVSPSFSSPLFIFTSFLLTSVFIFYFTAVSSPSFFTPHRAADIVASGPCHFLVATKRVDIRPTRNTDSFNIATSNVQLTNISIYAPFFYISDPPKLVNILNNNPVTPWPIVSTICAATVVALFLYANS